MEIFNKSGVINIVSNSKDTITFDTNSLEVKIASLNVSFPGEYEKSGILLEVKEYANILFYSFVIDTKHLVIVSSDEFEIKEEILSFFGDVDVLVIIGSKKGVGIFENIEARVIVPYGPSKQVFLATVGQNIPSVEIYKLKGELSEDSSEFVNLVE